MAIMVVRGEKELEASLIAAKRTLPLVMYSVTGKAAKDLQERVRSLTPRDTGKSRKQIKRSRTRRFPFTNKYVASVYTNSQNVVRLEFGTRAHVIRAKPGHTLRYVHRGRIKYRKAVLHPGTRPYRMFALGTAWYRREILHKFGVDIDIWLKSNRL